MWRNIFAAFHLQRLHHLYSTYGDVISEKLSVGDIQALFDESGVVAYWCSTRTVQHCQQGYRYSVTVRVPKVGKPGGAPKKLSSIRSDLGQGARRNKISAVRRA